MNRQYFVSYGHTDKTKTEAIITYLERCGLDLWYDKYIRPHFEWNKEIEDGLAGSAGLILIATNDAVRRPVVVREVTSMLERSLPVYVICLEIIRTNGLDKRIRELIENRQYIMLRRFSRLTLKAMAESIAHDLPLSSAVITQSEYINVNSDPRPAKGSNGEKYYRIELPDILPYSGTLLELDDQWYPQSIYDSGVLYSMDPEERSRIQEIRTPLQVQEFYRALLHTRQILVNRAFFQNSPVFRSVYESGGEAQKEALRSLLNQGVLVLTLMYENDPYQKTEYQSDRESWGNFLSRCTPYFMKFDWDSSEFNKRIARITLNETFPCTLMTLFAHPYTVRDYAARFGIREEDREAFASLLLRISDMARVMVMEKGEYKRTHLYLDYVTRTDASLPKDSPYRGITVRDTVMDPDKRFAKEIKQIADEIYAMNYAYSYLCDLKSGNMYLQKTDGTENQYRRILYADEVTGFIDDILWHIRSDQGDLKEIDTIPRISLAGLELDRIVRVRETEEWEQYITAVEFLKKRTYTWSLDAHGMCHALLAYRNMLSRYDTDCPKEPFAFTVTLRMSEYLMILVFRRNEQGEWEYLWKEKNTPPRETSMIHIAFEARDALRKQTIPSPEANILIFTGITDKSCVPFVHFITRYLEDASFTKTDQQE